MPTCEAIMERDREWSGASSARSVAVMMSRLIGAEWNGRQACLVVQIPIRGVAPVVTHGRRRGHGGTRYQHLVAIQLRAGPDEMTVGAGNRKSVRYTIGILQRETSADICEPEANATSVDRH